MRTSPSRAAVALQAWRTSRDMTQSDLAAMISRALGRTCSQPTMSRLLAGTVTPRTDLVGWLWREAGIDPRWWVEPSSSAPTPGERPKAA